MKTAKKRGAIMYFVIRSEYTDNAKPPLTVVKGGFDVLTESHKQSARQIVA